MASFLTHMVIGQEHLKYFREENEIEFLKGNIDPDYLHISKNLDKAKSHYGKPYNPKLTQKQNFENKTILLSYLKQNKLDNSYNRGYFLHLISDYYFYNKVIDIGLVENLNNNEVKTIYYDDYTKVQKFLLTKYAPKFLPEIESMMYIKNNFLNIYKDGAPKLFSMNEFEKYIEYCSKLDLDNFANDILSENLNNNKK